VIGKVAATDPENKALTFTLTKNSDALFELTDTGELSLVAGKKLDFETTTSYTLSVEVSDGTHKASADITITVENVVEPFITTWKTTEANEMITIGVTKELTYDYTIDWGDGTIEKNQTTLPSHTYVTANTYTVKVSGKFPSISMNEGKDAHKLQTIEQWGDIKWKSFYGAFAECNNMIYNAKDVPDLSQVASIAGIFARCTKFNADLNDWDVSTITDMRAVFLGASSFNGNISNWDVSKVTDMFGMFGECSKFNGDLSNWDVSNVTDMRGMFSHATSFTRDLNSWNVSKVTDMTDMFSSTDSFNGDLSKWDVSNVTKMIRMFINAPSFNGDLSQWDVSNVTEMGQMFSGATSFNGDVSQWDVSNV
ncbi:BspA family leucine-rich repeat surface protein, partial [Aquimarina megaterium]|uniref:BspA family leucine-rich repeat surface protein n=1 Tax=Aquimarina megaterium TaxID=1443666 RepID=UPI000472A608